MTDHGLTAYTRGCRCHECRTAKRDYERIHRPTYVAKLRASPIPWDAHGKASTYRLRGCRCTPCTEAHRIMWTANKEKAHRTPVPPNVTHGLYYVYQYYGCRCAPCKAANAKSSAAKRQRNRQRNVKS